jgi:hypothetical protein
MEKIPLEEEVQIYRRLLVRLHTARWTGNKKLLNSLLDKIGFYSYARTNSNGHYDEEEQVQIQTLLNLDK